MKLLVKSAALASAALLMASCSNEETLNVNPNVENGDLIGFNASTNGMTRAANVFCNNNKPGSFMVYAKNSDGVFINGDEIKYQESAWTNAVTRYWPKNRTVDFYGTVNGTFAWPAEGKTLPTISNFTVEKEVATQVDLMYAYTNTTDVVNIKNAVTMNFRHALSQIVFAGKVSDANLKVTVKGITVCNVNTGGTYEFPSVATTSNLAHPSAGTDVTDNSRGKWTATGTGNFGVTFTGVQLGTTATALTSANDSGKEYSSNALMLIPSTTLTKWDGKTAAKAEGQTGTYFLMDVQIVRKGVNEGEKDLEIWNGEIAIPAELSWEEGKKYTYTFNFTDGGVGGNDPETNDPVLVGIKFAVEVDEFIAADELNENVNI